MADRDATVVVCAHAEGLLLQKTWRSLLRSRAEARANALDVELVLVLDRADTTTRMVAAHLPGMEPRDVCIESNHGDVGLARNAGCRAARGDWIGVLDADDYVSSNWISASVLKGRTQRDAAIVHPEWLVYFEGMSAISRQRADDDPVFQRNALAVVNPWNSCSFAPTSIRAQFEYAPSDVSGRGFGHEDWHWHCETVASGIRHVIAAGTLHCVRAKSERSMNAEHQRMNAMVLPSRFFEPQ